MARNSCRAASIVLDHVAASADLRPVYLRGPQLCAAELQVELGTTQNSLGLAYLVPDGRYRHYATRNLSCLMETLKRSRQRSH